MKPNSLKQNLIIFTAMILVFLFANILSGDMLFLSSHIQAQKANEQENISFIREYQQLREILVAYLEVKRKWGWPRINCDEVLEKGDRNRHVATLRTRLKREPQFDIDLETEEETYFGDRLQQAVFNFQKRYGLTLTGTVGPQTRKILNLPVEFLIEKININLKRMRNIEKELGEKYILVNIPAFELEVIEAGKTILHSRTIIGKSSRPTPVFSTEITRLVLNPRWYIPQSIAVEDFLPRIKNDISYLDRENLKVYQKTENGFIRKNPEKIDWEALNASNFDYYIWQDAGPENYLGKVIFHSPNSRDIYLHDTPQKQLFSQRLRTYSSGCIRVEKALELTDYLLKYSNEYKLEEARKILKKGDETHIPLDESVPLHFVYLTAFVNDYGRIQFRKDIYGKEQIEGKKEY